VTSTTSTPWSGVAVPNATSPVAVVPHTAAHAAAVRAFNTRLQPVGWGWYEDHVPGWLAKGATQRAWREYWLAVDRGGEVRGAYALKPQQWQLGGETTIVTHWQGPVSEGVVDRSYSWLALHLLRDMLKKRPLLYSWGHGGRDSAIVQILRSMPGWLLHWTPLSCRVLRPFRCLRHNRWLRRTAAQRLALDALAITGVGAITIRALQAASSLRVGGRRDGGVSWEVCERFEGWADELWHRVEGDYPILAVRDREAMNAIAPAGRWPHGLNLRIRRGSETIGWAIGLDVVMHDDRRFGDLRVGTVADCLAAPADAPAVVAAVCDHLTSRDVDLVVSNQAHPDWSRAFAARGFLQIREGRLFAASPRLAEAMRPLGLAGLHLTNMDGEGPICLAP
jgi:hypothetical protein